jgi:hypothetical protein
LNFSRLALTTPPTLHTELSRFDSTYIFFRTSQSLPVFHKSWNKIPAVLVEHLSGGEKVRRYYFKTVLKNFRKLYIQGDLKRSFLRFFSQNFDLFLMVLFHAHIFRAFPILIGTPTKRQVSKRQASKHRVSKRPVSKPQVYKTSGLQNVRFQNLWFQNVQFLNLIYLLNKKYRNCQVSIPM